MRFFLVCGAFAAAAAVAFGAFGAHALRGRLSAEMFGVYETAVQYHFYHALGLLLIGVVGSEIGPVPMLRLAGALMLAGIVLFSGSLYVLALTGVRWWGAITPIGGVAFIVAWILLGVAVLRR